jgi:poly(ADP-ribose) glycohydrolase
MLFTEALDENEALEVKGAERFSTYTGYASTFRFQGDFMETVTRYV